MTDNSIQPGGRRVNRANILRRLGRLSFGTGPIQGLPAPQVVVFLEEILQLTFDTVEQATEWASGAGPEWRIQAVAGTAVQVQMAVTE